MNASAVVWVEDAESLGQHGAPVTPYMVQGWLTWADASVVHTP